MPGKLVASEAAIPAKHRQRCGDACRFWYLLLAGGDFSDLEEFTGMCEPS